MVENTGISKKKSELFIGKGTRKTEILILVQKML